MLGIVAWRLVHRFVILEQQSEPGPLSPDDEFVLYPASKVNETLTLAGYLEQGSIIYLAIA